MGRGRGGQRHGGGPLSGGKDAAAVVKAPVASRPQAPLPAAPPAADAPQRAQRGTPDRSAKAAAIRAEQADHARKFRAALDKAHGGDIDDRRTVVDQISRHGTLTDRQVERVVKRLGAKGVLEFDHATPNEIQMSKGYIKFPTDHRGRAYHGFRVFSLGRLKSSTS